MDCWDYKVLTFDSKGVFGGILIHKTLRIKLTYTVKTGGSWYPALTPAILAAEAEKLSP